MNKPLIAALVAAIAFTTLPALASPVSASTNGQPAVTSGLPTGTLVAQSSDSNDQSQSPTAPAPQSDANDK
ncbi:MAG: hypothetical protein KGJ66_01870 [Alphaproteobacteria bacterium]|jgi:hypothetical protein|nr:hypothetical protein [Alphaproteobacteria bacterium]